MMKKRIEAYFKSENDAESARAALQQLQVYDMIIDGIPESGYKLTFVPFTQPGLSWGVVAPVNINQEEQGEVKMTHVLEAEVKAEDYDKAMKILSEKDGYMKSE